MKYNMFMVQNMLFFHGLWVIKTIRKFSSMYYYNVHFFNKTIQINKNNYWGCIN